MNDQQARASDSAGQAGIVDVAGLLESGRPRGRLRLRTLVLIRWIALIGQAFALLLVHYSLGFDLPIVLALVVVGLSAAVNVVAGLRQPGRTLLRDRSAAAYLAFDLLQLTALLYLTGGLKNPFALLILAPVTIAAVSLSRRSIILLCALAAVCTTALALWHMPLPWGDSGFVLPTTYVVGTWTAVLVGVLFMAAYAGSIAEQMRRMDEALTATQLALAREQRVSALGALAAAAAHELGSPLSTIAVTAGELAREVPGDGPLATDIELLRSESARCREILARLAQRPPGEPGDAWPFSRVPLSALVEDAARPYTAELAPLALEAVSLDGSAEPEAVRRPEFIHGLGNLIHNALQFAQSRATVRTEWDADRVRVAVLDDGRGFAPAVLDRLGEPYISSRARGGGHMGLGVFIAVTLLEQTGATLSFANRRGGGARVEITWARDRLSHPETAQTD